MKRIVLIPLLIFSLSIGSIFIGGGTPAEAKRAEKKQPRVSRRHRLSRKTLTPRKKRSRISSRRTTRRNVLKKSRISRKRRSSRKAIRAKRIHVSKRRGRTSRRQVQLKSQQEAIRLQQQTTEAQRQADAARQEQEAAEQQRQAEAARLEREAAEQQRQAEETARLEREAEQQRQAEAARLKREAEQRRQAEEAARRREQEAAEAEATRRREQEAAEAEATRRREQEATEAEAARRREQEAAEAEAARLEREAAEQRRQAEATARLEQEAELQRQAEELKNLLAETVERQKQTNTRIGNVVVYRMLNEEDLAEVVSNVHEDIQTTHIGSGAHEIEEVLKQAALKKQINKYIMRNQDPMYEYTKLHQDETLRVVQQTFLRITQGEHLETALTSVICLNRNMREFNVGEEEAKKIGKFIGIGQNYMPREKAKNLYDAIQEIERQGNKGTSEEIERNILYALEVNEENCELLTSEHFREEAQRLNDHIHDQWEEGQDPEDNLKRIFDDIERQKSQAMWTTLGLEMSFGVARAVDRIHKELNKSHNFPNEIGRGWYTEDEHELRYDFVPLQEFFETRQDNEMHFPIRFNYTRFYFDPFQLDDQLLPESATNEDLLDIYGDLMQAYQNHKRQVVKENFILPDEDVEACTYNALFSRIQHRERLIENNEYEYADLNEERYNSEMERRFALRKRMIRLFKHLTEGENALDPDQEIAQAKFVLKISKNDVSRCIDGVEDWLLKQELKHIFHAPKDAGFGVLVSQLLNEDKMKHFEKHSPVNHALPAAMHSNPTTEHNFPEISTGAIKLAIQRCRHGFALPVPYARQSIGNYGGLNHEDLRYIFEPVNIIERFFDGGQIDFVQRSFESDDELGRYSVTFEPYTPDTLIDRVHGAWRSGKIRDELVQRLIKTDYVLNEAHRRIFRDAVETENDYFQYVSLPDNYEDLTEEEKLELKASTMKPTVFKRLLVKTDFLEDEIESQQ